MKHWFNQHGGVWPLAACGKVPGRKNLTLAMGEVDCSECQIEIQASLDKLRDGFPALPASWMPLPGVTGAIHSRIDSTY